MTSIFSNESQTSSLVQLEQPNKSSKLVAGGERKLQEVSGRYDVCYDETESVISPKLVLKKEPLALD